MSFGLLRTNVGLTTNVKLIVSSNYNLYLDSINSDTLLSDDKYKKFQFIKENYYDELVPYFFKGIPQNIAFGIQNNTDVDLMHKDFSKQNEDIYLCGARNISSNKYYSEEFEYFAPLYLDKNLPETFIIFRVDGPGIINLNKSNFREEILEKLKCVKVFDLSTETNLGFFLNRNIVENSNFPLSSLEIDFRRLEFSKWNGIDYETGGYSSKSFFLDDTFENENTYYDLDKFIFDGFKKNSIIYPNIYNLSFLFDDTPSTPNSLRKWSANRYFGFYINKMESVKNVTPYQAPTLKDDIIIEEGNYLTTSDYSDPFKEGYKDGEQYYVEYKGDFYKVEPYVFQVEVLNSKKKTRSDGSREKAFYKETKDYVDVTKYKIVSDIDLVGKESYLNRCSIYIDENYYIKGYTETFEIEDFDTADVWIIKIGDKYHNILKDDDGYKVYTDYGFEFEDTYYKYWINVVDPNYTTTVNFTLDENTKPPKFEIFKLNFCDIKDLDTDITITDYARYEYEFKDSITDTDEPKFYSVDYKSTSLDKGIIDFNYKGRITSIPISSEYMASGDLIRLDDQGDIIELWRKNPVFAKFGGKESLSAYDYSYRLNNAFLSEDWNRNANLNSTLPIRSERNLDYFYSVRPSKLYKTLDVGPPTCNPILSGMLQNNLDKIKSG